MFSALWLKRTRLQHYDSAGSIATSPHESDFDDDQIRNMLASPLYLQEREASADRPRVDHSSRETLWQVHLTSEKVQGNLSQCSLKRKPSQVSDRAFPKDINQIEEKTTLFRFSDPEAAARLVLEERQDHLLAEAKSEILMQECIVDALNTLEMDTVNYGCEEPRKEQARLHEELAQRDRVLRETLIRSIYEVEELKTAQEMRITLQEYTSQLHELQERRKHFQIFPEVQSI